MVMVEILHRSTPTVEICAGLLEMRGANQAQYEGESESDEAVNRDANAISSGVSESTSS